MTSRTSHKAEPLSFTDPEHALRVREAINKALGSKARSWWRTPHADLGGAIPACLTPEAQAFAFECEFGYRVP